LDSSDASPAHALQVDIEQRGQGSVYRLTVARPERLNVLDTAALTDMGNALAEICGDDAARAVILRGAGNKAWIGGADINEMVTLKRETARAFITRLHRVCLALRELPVPVIAHIDGFCLGAGLEIAACCDLRIATTDSHFGMPEVQVGIPSVIEAALLPRLIGAGHARDLVLTGRIIEAQEALAWGLVETAVPAEQIDAVVDERLTMILNAGPDAVRSQKVLCRQWEELPLDEAIQAGIDALADAFHGDEPREHMQRFLDRPRNKTVTSGDCSDD
jgi:enoyl-CoA hydratase/carnithine racemase